MGALWNTAEHHLRKGYHISQCLLEYTFGEDGHEVEEIYNTPSTDRWEKKSSQWDFGATFEGLQSKSSEDLGWKYNIYSTLL
jgi:hypothetical protein